MKAWSAACHGDWIGKGLDRMMAEYNRLEKESEGMGEEIKALDQAIDFHTVENRNKRKALQEKRNHIADTLKRMGAQIAEGQKALEGLYQNVESNLAVAAHAEAWEWKEVDTTSEEKGAEELLKQDTEKK
jgi:chromosome segregation ATPase